MGDAARTAEVVAGLNADWYIETEGGEMVCGPFSTFTDAQLARYWVEQARKPETFWIRRHD